MKKALILHGTSATSESNWFMWLKEQLEKSDFEVWLPDLPNADRPNIQTYNEFLINNRPWEFDEETLIIGHSSGAVGILGLLPELSTKVKASILVGAFKTDLGWDSLNELFINPLDFEADKLHCEKFIFIHSDNDPYCPLEHAEYLRNKLNGKLIIFPGQKHFSYEGDHKYNKFPKLLDILKESRLV